MPEATITRPVEAADGRARVVTAARECFRRDGARKTRIAAVAAASGMVRQTVYAFVSSRSELLELALAERLLELSDIVVERFDPSQGTLPEAFVDCLVTITELVRADNEFQDVSEAMGQHAAFAFMTGPSGAQAAAIRGVEPVYRRAVAEGALRPEISLDDVAYWTRSVCSPLTAREDLDHEELAALIRKFAVPALLRDQ